jgi:RhtB (resistance to homoserine/threonine) family protein
MPGIENYLGFIIAGVLLNLTPGADTMYILTRSISQGRKAGIYSVYGIVTGAMVHTLFAAFGLSVILSTSATIFAMIKYAGVIYLMYLGIKMISDKSNIFEEKNLNFKERSLFRIYRQGMLTNLLNPKVALFYLSFLPQFIRLDNPYGPLPFLILGFTFITTGTIWCMFLAYSSSFMTKTLRNNTKTGKYLQKLSGVIFIILGLKLALGKK